jgi:hypothetical protein
MQEEKFEEKEQQPLSVFELFAAAEETYEEAQARAAEENKSFVKTEFIKMDKFGVYTFRILPIAPKADGTIDRKSYEYPIHQLLMKIQKPSDNGKQQFTYVSVCRANYAGYKTDLIDTYRKLAIAEAKAQNDDDLAEKLDDGFKGGVKYDYSHAMYVFDMDERAKGIQLLRLSHSQFKTLDECKFKLWQKKLKKNPKYPCPISSIANAFPVEIEKKKNGSKTEYSINIDNESDVDVLTSEELTALLNAPRIPEVMYRYTRFHFEATLIYLKQCDEQFDLKVMEMDEMKEAIESLKAELPSDDTSSFSFDKKGDGDPDKENTSGVITIDSLFNMYDELQEKGLNDKTEEGQELRGKIREFIEQEKLDIRMTRTTTNAMLLDMIEEALQGGTPQNNESESAGEQEKAKEEMKEEPAPEPESKPEPEQEEEEDEDPRTTRNDDTNEPAVQRERRSARMVRRRER